MTTHPLDQLATLQRELEKRGQRFHIKTDGGGFDFIHPHGKSCAAVTANFQSAIRFIKSLPFKE